MLYLRLRYVQTLSQYPPSFIVISTLSTKPITCWPILWILVSSITEPSLWAEIARNLTESVILPMDLNWYSIFLTDSFRNIQSRYGPLLAANNATLRKYQKLLIQLILPNNDFQNISNRPSTVSPTPPQTTRIMF